VSDDWMPQLQLPISEEQFTQLPRNAAYRYDYVEGVAWLNPRPRYYHAQLDFNNLCLEGQSDVFVRRLEERDWEPLVELFSESFRHQQPFCGQPDAKRVIAARASLAQTRNGGDGPLIEQASFVARGEDAGLIGALLVTLLPPGDPTDWDSYHWMIRPPRDCVEMGYGVPHLTWVFVHPERAGRGIGTSLLRTAVEELRRMGFTSMLSTFITGNDSSVLWHWRVGFKLLTYPGSPRRYYSGG
jgi:GNAT superfamily N-acetyltransferase